MAEIEEDTEGMTTDIQNMSSDMEIMSSGVSECTKEIERVNRNGGSAQLLL